MRFQETHGEEKRLVRTAQLFEPGERLVADLHVEIETVRHIRELHGPRLLSRLVDRQLILLVARILVQRRTLAPRTLVQTVFRAVENLAHARVSYPASRKACGKVTTSAPWPASMY